MIPPRPPRFLSTRGKLGLAGNGAQLSTFGKHSRKPQPTGVPNVSDATPAAPARIFVVEDEPKLASLLADYLIAAGYEVTVLHNGLQASERIREAPPALLLLDLMLPGKSGLDICREVRAFSNLPIIMITAKVEEIDRLLGLELGADDYICKPFSPREVVARVKAILRRTRGSSDAPGEGRGLERASNLVADMVIDEAGFLARYKGHALDLTPAEFRLLRFFAANPGRVYSRDQLLSKLYDDERIVTDRTIDTHVKNLRRKLHRASPPEPDEEERIVSVYGVGYKYTG